MRLRTIVILLASGVICQCFSVPAHPAMAQEKSTQSGITSAQSKTGTTGKPGKTGKSGKAGAAVKTAPADKPAKAVKDPNPYHLKENARQKVCIGCHADFEPKLKKAFIHTPLKTEGCTACHSPHASSHDKQLSEEPDKLCLSCHMQIQPAGAQSVHKVVAEGKCLLCHDPHSSDNKFNLLKAGNELCFGCHKEKAEAIAKNKFKHAPVEKACVSCHNPHASTTAKALLTKEVPTLCLDCHKTDNALFVKQHQGFPVAGARCTSCHSVHGSNRTAIIYDTAHPPFLSKNCTMCHESPAPGKPVALKKKGLELCRGCHNTVVNDMLGKNRLHWPILGKEGCLNCHNPHASPQKGLLKAKPVVLCGSCHQDTIQRQERSITKHQPMQDGACTTCHSPHASDNELLFVKPLVLDVCGQCHDWGKHASHPVGPKVIDKRNRNLILQCTSCHRAHGSEFKHMFPTPTETDLCTQCHVEYRR